MLQEELAGRVLNYERLEKHDGAVSQVSPGSVVSYHYSRTGESIWCYRV